MEYYEEKYKDLLYNYEKLQKRYENLQENYNKLDLKLDSANYKIEHELEPRIQSEKRAYDRWVTSPER